MTFSSVFSISLAGINAFSAGLESVSANIANSQTAGYKRVRTDFSALVGATAGDRDTSVGDAARGAGVTAEARLLNGEQGALTRTGEATNIAISGNGFFAVADNANGASRTNAALFTRAGAFTADANGNLVNEAGYFLLGAPAAADGNAPTIGDVNSLQTVNLNVAPAQAADPDALGALTSVEIDADGRVLGTYATGETFALFQIPLALFINPQGLEQADATTFHANDASGEASLARARDGAAGAIEGAALELSTVDIGQEFSDLIVVQRAYSSSARALTVADDLWRTLTETAA
ncbi:MAG: flagellar hook basal-body protein [Pseudomonadota bacterium]